MKQVDNLNKNSEGITDQELKEALDLQRLKIIELEETLEFLNHIVCALSNAINWITKPKDS